MDTMRHLVVLLIWGFAFVGCERPTSVNVGAVFTFDSVIGRAAKPAMEAALADVNSDSNILNGTSFNLIFEDADCNVFLGSIETFQVLQQGVVAIIGPQSSGLAHMISEIANGLQVPLVSYAATDPTLSALQFPFFLRTTESDSNQMSAMADLIVHYDWKEVIVVYMDNDYGRNGVSYLDNELEKKMARVAHKVRLPTRYTDQDVRYSLNQSKLYGPRVYVVHVNPDRGMNIFNIAKELQMITLDYVWLATHWLSASLDSLPSINQSSFLSLQGIIGFRQYIPESSQKKAFVSRWKKMQSDGEASSELNAYGYYAYDTVWTIARAIDKVLEEYPNITFSFSEKLRDMEDSNLQLDKLKSFDGGKFLRKTLLQTNFTGLTGHIMFETNRSRVSGGYEVLNINNLKVNTVGYWSTTLGLSRTPAEYMNQTEISHLEPSLLDVVWPGGGTDRPRGWVIASDEKPLIIGVPNRTAFVDFVTEKNHTIVGYCIDVFKEARKLVPYDVPYRFQLFGDGVSNPSYDDLVKKVENHDFDAAVGDIAIVTNRTKLVDFTQPYIATGLVIVAPVSTSKASAWVFLKPFSVEMWCMTAASFVMIAIVIWILEHRVNNDFRGPPKRQLATMFLFSFSTLFKKNQEDTVSPLGRMVMVVWLFLLMVLTSSYTASLTSILTVQQLSSSITGIDSLITNNWPIGYQVGSFAQSYLKENLNINPSRLVSLRSPEAYETALRKGPSNGGVAAIVDELPYIELFLSERPEFGIVGQPFTKSGWGFAFQRDSQLAIDMSTAILKLSESGKLQELRSKWFCKKACPGDRKASSEPNQLRLINFWGLYLFCGAFALAALCLFLLRSLRQFMRYKKKQMESSSPAMPSTTCSQVIYNFFDFIDEKEEAIKKMFADRNIPHL
uniref:Glutamate receptor n=1 Tax=Kalanchoe fedtschenkoi TaxID=63787 RepID=A0A7N0TFM3_KALFE